MQVMTQPAAPVWLEPILAVLDPEQRAAATLPSGPAQIIAPAGSGKTTTLLARLAVLVARGTAPDAICVVTFNREAAADVRRRVEARLVPHLPQAAGIEVRTLHALARQILIDAGRTADLIADRLPLLRAARRRVSVGRASDAPPLPEAAMLDAVVSAWKIEGRQPPQESAPVIAAYQTMLELRGALDFDDLVVVACDLLETNPALRVRWQSRFEQVLVDEFQDVDAAQLRLVRLLAAPEDNLFVVGDDDQTIYAWRLADVRRILDFGTRYPTARRVQLATNYRCPETVVEASRRLIDANVERFSKRIRPFAAERSGTLLALPTERSGWEEEVMRLAVAETRARRRACILARTRAELVPVSLALLRAGVPHATVLPAPAEDERVVALVDDLRRAPAHASPFPTLLRCRAARGWRRGDAEDSLGDDDHAALDACLGWAVGFARADAYLAAYDDARRRLASLRVPDALLELVTVHGAKGREWDLVVVVGFEEDRFPNRRSLVEAADAERALEEERRLAYVAMTRATRRLVLAFDPARPSRFLAESGATGPPPPR